MKQKRPFQKQGDAIVDHPSQISENWDPAAQFNDKHIKLKTLFCLYIVVINNYIVRLV
jgi:hypothetical protein